MDAGTDQGFSQGMGGGRILKKISKFCRLFLGRPNWFSERPKAQKSPSLGRQGVESLMDVFLIWIFCSCQKCFFFRDQLSSNYALKWKLKVMRARFHFFYKNVSKQNWIQKNENIQILQKKKQVSNFWILVQSMNSL